MAVLSIQNLLLKFGAGKSPNSGDYLDLIDTLADDRNAVYFSATAPADTGANPLWFNTSTNVLSVYSNEAWSNIDLSLKAPLASPTLTGTPLAPTATAGTNTTQIATTAFVKTAVDNVVAAAPGALDTLDELALALNDDANFATTVTNSLAGKVSKAGGDIITSSLASTIPLVLKGAASQTADLQQWQNSAGTVITRVRPDGQIGVGSTLITGTNFFVNNTISTTNVVATIRGAVSQTANLQEWQDSAGTVLTKVDSAGSLTIGTSGTFISASNGRGVFTTSGASQIALVVKGAASQTANLQEWQNSAGTILARVSSGGAFVTSAVGVFGAQSNTPNAQLYVLANSTTYPTFVAKAIASQTANLTEWQDSSGSALSFVGPTGVLTLNNGNSTPPATYSLIVKRTSFFDTGDAASVGIIVRARASQTGNLQEWQNSSGTILSRIGSDGRARIGGSNGIGTGITASALGAGSIDPSWTVITVKGAASQTANLQEWQDSAGTVLAKVDQTGYMWSPTQDVAAQSSWTGAVTLSQTDSLKTYIKKQLTGNTTVTVSDGVAGKTYSCTLELQQDTTGSRSIILKGCRTAYGVTLVLTTTASATDIVRLEWNGTYWTAFMGAAQISVPSSWV